MLLALWLPATLHCDLEAAGVTNILGCHDHRAAGPAFGTDDHCHSIEGVSYKLDFGSSKSPRPADVILFLLADPRLFTVASPPRRITVESKAAPPEIARTWQFAARAAPPARAPSSEA
ncbi:MAG: hypothetical protein JNL92_09290 [Opitutaceae bacterium]|nr:hypothetical protein [Opitutaceae bacterium]